MKKTLIFSYVVVSDLGFSPNPFRGWCTLACCKPIIRRTASVGDWVVGLAPKKFGNVLVYVMRIDEMMSFVDYWIDDRFRLKIPDWNTSKHIDKCGDNIYGLMDRGKFKQMQSWHSLNQTEKEDEKTKEQDLSGNNVLISNTFSYFGKNGPSPNSSLTKLIVGQGHKKLNGDKFISVLEQLMATVGTGILSSPREWPENDDSWRQF